MMPFSRTHPPKRAMSAIVLAVLLAISFFAVMRMQHNAYPNAGRSCSLSRCGGGSTLYPPRTARLITSISMLSDTEGWAVGYDDTHTAHNDIYTPLLFHNQGGHWTSLTFPQSTPSCSPNWISMISPSEGWATGCTGYLHYRAGKWEVATFPTTVAGYDVNITQVFSANDMWGIATNNATQMTDIAHTDIAHFDGTHWSLQHITLPPEMTLLRLAMTSTHDGWVVVEPVPDALHPQYEIFQYTQQGWIPIPLPTGVTISDIAVSADGHAWAIGSTGDQQQTPVLLQEANAHWNITDSSFLPAVIPSAGPGLSRLLIYSSAMNDVWIVRTTFANSQSSIWHFDGAKWQTLPDSSVTPNIGIFVHAASITQPGDIWFVGDGKHTLLHAKDGIVDMQTNL